MKKNLLILGWSLGLALSGEASAQINYSQGFEGTHNWTATEFFTTNEVPCEGSQSFVSDLHGGFVPNGNDATVSPSLGNSDGSLLTFNYTYKLVNSNNPGSPVLNSADWGSFTVSWGTSASGPWIPIETINTTNHVQSIDCAERIATFTPANGSQIFIRINTVLNSFSNFVKIYIDGISATQVICTTPAPTADAIQEFCNDATVAILEAEGDYIYWYDEEEGGEPLNIMTPLIDGEVYYASQLPDAGCESMDRTAVTVQLTNVPIPTGDSIQEFTNSDGMPVFRPFSDLNIVTSTGAAITWYLTLEDAQAGENGLTQDDGFTQSGIYYVTQTIESCESDPFAVAVDVILSPDKFSHEAFRYYPNPVKGMFTVTYKENITSVTVHNILGQQVLVNEFNSRKAVIDMSPLQTGTYIINIATANAVKVVRVVKN